MLALDERQTNLLATLNETLKKEENKKNIDNKLKVEGNSNNEVINFRTNDKIHNDIINKDVVMNKINYNKEISKPKRRQIWNVNLGQRQGSLQSGIRPCLVDSNDVNNNYSNVINVYPLTSQMTKSKIPVHIEIEGYGLKEKSIILIEQGLPIDIRFQLLNYIGTVDDFVMKKVDIARNIQHGDLQPKTPLEYLPQIVQDEINNKLDIIKSIEKTISNIKNKNLEKHLFNERESQLILLQSICETHNINYKDYYVMYRRESERIVV